MKSTWPELLSRVEALEDLSLDGALVSSMERNWNSPAWRENRDIHFFTPTFKSFQTSEIQACGRGAWPAVSITGGRCALQCDHCKAKILEPMIPATTPRQLRQVVDGLVAKGSRGMLLTGGSNRRNQVEYGPYWPEVRRIKNEYPEFRIACHTALVDAAGAAAMEAAGIDVAMMDVIGAQDTITQVYHLKRGVEDFATTLQALTTTTMKIVPHIVIGLHYGHFLGEWNALAMLQRYPPDAVVLVVVMPQYAPAKRPFVTPSAHAVGRFFMDARAALADLPLLLGCARPAGIPKQQIDSYAVMAGLNGIAHPAEGSVELAVRLGRRVSVTPACCSVAVGGELMAEGDNEAIELDLDAILAEERRPGSAAVDKLSRIPVVVRAS